MRKILLWLMMLAMSLTLFVACDKQEKSDGKDEKERTEEVNSTAEEKSEDSTAEQKTEKTEQPEEETEEAADNKAINLAALDSIEQSDTFALHITKQEAVKDAFNDGPIVNLDGSDAIVVTLLNQTNTTVDEVKILLLCTDTEGNSVDLGKLASPSNITISNGQVLSYDEHVKVMGSETAAIGAGESKSFSVRCSLDKIHNVNAIVYSYVDANGKEIFNPNYEKWLTATLPSIVN